MTGTRTLNQEYVEDGWKGFGFTLRAFKRWRRMDGDEYLRATGESPESDPVAISPSWADVWAEHLKTPEEALVWDTRSVLPQHVSSVERVLQSYRRPEVEVGYEDTLRGTFRQAASLSRTRMAELLPVPENDGNPRYADLRSLPEPDDDDEMDLITTALVSLIVIHRDLFTLRQTYLICSSARRSDLSSDQVRGYVEGVLATWTGLKENGIWLSGTDSSTLTMVIACLAKGGSDPRAAAGLAGLGHVRLPLLLRTLSGMIFPSSRHLLEGAIRAELDREGTTNEDIVSAETIIDEARSRLPECEQSDALFELEI